MKPQCPFWADEYAGFQMFYIGLLAKKAKDACDFAATIIYLWREILNGCISANLDSNGVVEPSIRNELDEFKKFRYAYSDADHSMFDAFFN